MIENVVPSIKLRPEPFADVFHPTNKYPVFSRVSALKTVTVEPALYGDNSSIGGLPLVLLFP